MKLLEVTHGCNIHLIAVGEYMKEYNKILKVIIKMQATRFWGILTTIILYALFANADKLAMLIKTLTGV